MKYFLEINKKLKKVIKNFLTKKGSILYNTSKIKIIIIIVFILLSF